MTETVEYPDPNVEGQYIPEGVAPIKFADQIPAEYVVGEIQTDHGEQTGEAAVYKATSHPLRGHLVGLGLAAAVASIVEYYSPGAISPPRLLIQSGAVLISWICGYKIVNPR